MNETPKRLSPSKETLNLLFARSGNSCAFPGCTHLLIDEEDQFIAQVCHIEAALPGGERYNELSDNESRRKPENLLLLCYHHHIKTNNVDRYPVEELHRMKSEHEAQFQTKAAQLVPTFEFIAKVYYDELQKITDQLSRLENQVEAVKNETSEINTATKAILTAVSGQGFLPARSNSIHAPVSDQYQLEIDAAMSLRSSYRQDLAIERLKVLKESHWNDFNNLEKYKLLANLGICYSDLAEFEKAAQFYLDAFTFQPNRVRAITLAASANIILGDGDKAAELARAALALEPGNSDAYNSLIVAEGKKLDLSSIIELVPKAYRDQTDVALAISNEARKKDNYTEAINWAERAISSYEGKNMPMVKAYLATVIFESIHYPFDVFSGQVSQDMANRAKYVIELYNSAWAEVKGTLLAPVNTDWLKGRAQAKKMVGDLKGYYADMLECAECKSSLQNLHNLAYAAIAVNENDKAYACSVEMEKFALGEEYEQVQMVRAEIMYFTAHYEEAINLLERVTIEKISDQLMLEMLELLVAVYKRGGHMEKAVTLNNSLLVKFPGAIRPCLERALDARNAGEVEKDLEALDLALSRITDETSEFDIRMVAVHAVQARAFGKAIPLYENITDLKIYGSLTKSLLEAYYRAGETKKVLVVCQDLINRYGPSYELTHMLTDTYHLINDNPAAISSCLDHLAVYPDDQRISVKLLLLYEQVNDVEAIKRTLAGFERIDQTHPVAVQFKIAELFLLAELPDLFYTHSVTCWKRNYSQREAHEHFIFNSLTATRLYGELENPERVLHEVATVLEDDEAKKLTFFITDTGKGGIPEEVAAGDTVGNALLGKCVDDEAKISGRNFKLTEILHPYNFAKRESYRLMQEKFIDSKAFRVLKKHDSDDPKVAFQELYALLDADGQQRQEIEEMYKQRPVPLGAIARGQRENPIKTWNNYTAWHSPGIAIMNGKNEIEIALKKLGENCAIIIDAITLNSIASIGLLSELASMGNPLAVSQSSLNVFHNLIREYEVSRGGFVSMGKRNGQYMRSELDAQEIGQYLDFLKNLVNWIEQHCQVLPCRPALEMSAHDKKDMDDLYGESFAETLLIAGSSNYLLYSEEWTFRSMAYQYFQTDGFNSFILSSYLVTKGLLSNEDFHLALEKMIGLNYQGIPVNSTILVSILEKAADSKHPVFQNAIKGMASNLTDFKHAQATCLLLYHGIMKSESLRNKVRENPLFFSEIVYSTLQILFSSYSTSEQVKNSLVEACKTLFKSEHPFTVKVLGLIHKGFMRFEKS